MGSFGKRRRLYLGAERGVVANHGAVLDAAAAVGFMRRLILRITSERLSVDNKSSW